MNNGWISLHRSIKEHWLYANNEYLAAWIKMLIAVNFKDAKPQMIKGVLVECKRGQSTNSLDTWVSIFGKGWSKQRVRTFFKLLERDKIINTESVKVTTRLTVCKYDTYQSLKHEANTQLTLNQHDTNTGATSIEEGNKEKKAKKEDKGRYTPPTLQEVIIHAQKKAVGNPTPYITKAKDAYAFYEGNMRQLNADVWKDGNGNTVKNWKLKLNNNWFNKVNPEATKPRMI